MNKIILSIFLMFSLHSFSQNAAPDTVFVFNANGLTDFIVKKVPNKTKEELYRRTVEWITTSTKKPKDVIVSQAEGDKLKFEGTKSCYFSTNYGGVKRCTDGKYQFEITFKDGKYKLDILSMSNLVSSTTYVPGGWHAMPLTKSEDLFDDKGKIKLYSLDNYKAIAELCNTLNNNLFNFLKTTVTPTNGEW